jgi:hypothetical protein
VVSAAVAEAVRGRVPFALADTRAHRAPRPRSDGGNPARRGGAARSTSPPRVPPAGMGAFNCERVPSVGRLGVPRPCDAGRPLGGSRRPCRMSKGWQVRKAARNGGPTGWSGSSS